LYIIFYLFDPDSCNVKKERVFSQVEMKHNEWYHVALTFTFESNLTDLALFINGTQDSEVFIYLKQGLI
jgi:hypothetical protein